MQEHDGLAPEMPTGALPLRACFRIRSRGRESSPIKSETQEVCADLRRRPRRFAFYQAGSERGGSSQRHFIATERAMGCTRKMALLPWARPVDEGGRIKETRLAIAVGT